MSVLTRDQILAAQDLKTVDVAVPEWGGSVRVQMMTGTQRDEFMGSLVGADGKAQGQSYRVKLVACCLVDEAGQRLFSVADVAALGSKSAVALDRVFEACDKLNGPSAAAVDEAEKNSEAGQTGASS